MTKKQTELSEELREAVFEAARAGAAEAYTQNTGYPETAGIVVNVVSGLYYSYKGAVYLAKADMPNCVYPPDTAGLWQWEKVT